MPPSTPGEVACTADVALADPLTVATSSSALECVLEDGAEEGVYVWAYAERSPREAGGFLLSRAAAPSSCAESSTPVATKKEDAPPPVRRVIVVRRSGAEPRVTAPDPEARRAGTSLLDRSGDVLGHVGYDDDCVDAPVASQLSRAPATVTAASSRPPVAPQPSTGAAHGDPRLGAAAVSDGVHVDAPLPLPPPSAGAAHGDPWLAVIAGRAAAPPADAASHHIGVSARQLGVIVSSSPPPAPASSTPLSRAPTPGVVPYAIAALLAGWRASVPTQSLGGGSRGGGGVPRQLVDGSVLPIGAYAAQGERRNGVRNEIEARVALRRPSANFI